MNEEEPLYLRTKPEPEPDPIPIIPEPEKEEPFTPKLEPEQEN